MLSSCSWTGSSVVVARTTSVEKGGGGARAAGVDSAIGGWGGGEGVSTGSGSGFGCFWNTESMGGLRVECEGSEGVKGVVMRSEKGKVMKRARKE